MWPQLPVGEPGNVALTLLIKYTGKRGLPSKGHFDVGQAARGLYSFWMLPSPLGCWPWSVAASLYQMLSGLLGGAWENHELCLNKCITWLLSLG